MLRNKLFQVILGISMILISGCDDLLTTPPLDQIASDLWWENETQVEMMVNDCYNYLWSYAEVGFPDCFSDNAKYRDSQTYITIGNGTYDENNSYVRNQWRYDVIARLNFVLEGIEKAKSNITEAQYRQFKAQVRFIRAFNYYQMLFYYGDIPLITKVITVEESREVSRQPRAEVLSFVTNELEDILQDIEAVPVEETGRINKDAVNAYLTRVNLFEKNYEKAIQYADAVINSGKYELFNSYDGLFRPQNDGNTKEVILERQYLETLYVHDLNRKFSASGSVYDGWAHVNVLQSLVDEYECINGHPYDKCEELGCEYAQKRIEVESDTVRGEYQFRDPRLDATVIYPFWEWKVNGQVTWRFGVDDPSSPDYIKNLPFYTGFLVTKWVDLEGVTADRIRAHKNITILRYGDILLMKAEALIELNQNLNEAANLINQIRERAGMPQNVTVTSQDQMRKALRHERRVETALEGLRYFDIIRWRIGNEVKSGPVYGARLKALSEEMDNKFVEDRFWEDKMYLFPIPQNAKDNNPNLTQNPGW